MSSYFLLFLRLLRFLSLGGYLFKSFTKMRPKRRIFALCKYLAIKLLIRILRSYPYFSIFQNKKKERFCAAPSCSMPHACKKCGRLKKSRPTAQTFYNGAKVRIYFLSCKFPLKNLRKMSFTSRDLFGACWMRSSTSKSKLMVRTFVVLPLPFGVLFHLLFVFSSCSIIFVFTVCFYSNILPRLCPCYRFIRPWHALQCITAYKRTVRLSALLYSVTYPWLHALLPRHIHINVYNAACFFLVCWSAVKVLANIFQP